MLLHRNIPNKLEKPKIPVVFGQNLPGIHYHVSFFWSMDAKLDSMLSHPRMIRAASSSYMQKR
jgi:hypothetical protein